jgi:hypothetical protein
MTDIKVVYHKRVSATGSVPDGTRKEIEEAIADTLRSKSKELVWEDSLDGIHVDCVKGNDTWRPRRRFFLNGEGE